MMVKERLTKEGVEGKNGDKEGGEEKYNKERRSKEGVNSPQMRE